MPERPPITNIDTKPMANSMGVVKRMLPRQSVPSQLKVLMADGTAMTIVDIMKLVPSAGVSTGRESSRRMAVMKSDQMTSGRRNQVIPGARMLMMVVM